MKTHNAFMYHCLNCGNVVHSERKPRPPRCCDHEMVLAAAETIVEREEDIPVESEGVHYKMTDPAIKPR